MTLLSDASTRAGTTKKKIPAAIDNNIAKATPANRNIVLSLNIRRAGHSSPRDGKLQGDNAEWPSYSGAKQ